jgi:RNA polymerase sigma factor (sigma-70 family)
VTPDAQLLSDYAARGSEDAFRALVERHSGFVYYTALRQLNNPALAEEATQVVFISLARKASKLKDVGSVSGWLFRATRFAARNLAREAARRERREQEAFMETLNFGDNPESVWSGVAPLLNDALEMLPVRERDAVLLRFFRENSHKEVAHALEISEDAAKMRVSRALERLRAIFAKQGFTVTASGLLAAFSTFAAQAAPAELTASVIKATAATISMVTPNTGWAGFAKFMAWSKTKITIVAGLLLLTGGTASFVLYKLDKWELLSVRLRQPSYDRSTPKGALFFMRRALVSGDPDGYADSFVRSAEDEEFRQSLMRVVSAFARLRRQLATTYSEASANVVVANLAPAAMPESMIDAATEKRDGERILFAVGSKKAKLVTLELYTSDGVWRLKPESLFGGLSRDGISEVMTQFATVIDKTIPEIAKGKYADAYQVQLAIKHEMN